MRCDFFSDDLLPFAVSVLEFIRLGARSRLLVIPIIMQCSVMGATDPMFADPTPASYVEVAILSLMAFGGGAFGR